MTPEQAQTILEAGAKLRRERGAQKAAETRRRKREEREELEHKRRAGTLQIEYYEAPLTHPERVGKLSRAEVRRRLTGIERRRPGKDMACSPGHLRLRKQFRDVREEIEQLEQIRSDLSKKSGS